jgi:outer membrane receptor protein involved in Fe transport
MIRARRGFVYTFIWLALAACQLAGHAARAQERSFTFDIPGEPLAQALRDYARIARRQIIFTDDLVSNRQSPILRGPYTAAAALALLLEGTGLSAQTTSSGALMIKRGNTGHVQADPPAEDIKPTPSADPQAQTDFDRLEEIVVTAQKRSENVQETPISITVLNGADLERQGRNTVSQILEDVPGVVAWEQQPGANNSGTNIVIRGLATSGNVYATATAPTTAVYVDNVLQGVGGDFDLNRVEILRGPQGTLYGRSATGGVVSVVTNDPVQKFEVEGLLEVGDYSLRHEEAVFNAPLTSDLAIRIAADALRQNGYLSNGDNDADEKAVRAKLLYQPSEQFSALFGALVLEQGLYGLAQFPTFPDDNDPSGYNLNLPALKTYSHNTELWGEAHADLGFAALTFIPTWRQYTLQGESIQGPAVAENLSMQDTPRDHAYTGELRLASQPESAVKWVLGAFSFNRSTYSSQLGNGYGYTDGLLTLGGPIVLATNTPVTHDLGLFGEATYEFLPGWQLTGGLRHDTDWQHLSAVLNIYVLSPPLLSNYDFHKSFNDWTYKVQLQRQLTSDNDVYGKVSTGYEPGSINYDGQLYQPEQLTAFEVGSKNRFLSGRLQLNGSVFYYDYQGFQNSLTVCENPACTVAVQRITAVPARFIGGEIESIWLVTPKDRLALSPSYNDATFTGASAVYDLGTSEVPSVPRWTLTASYVHTFSLPGGSSLDARGALRTYAGSYTGLESAPNAPGPTPPPGADAYQPSFAIGDLSLTWNSSADMYSVTAYARNIGDKLYKYDYDGTGSVYLGAPRTFGAMFKIRWDAQ